MNVVNKELLALVFQCSIVVLGSALFAMPLCARKYMRTISKVENNNKVKRVMIYHCDEGTYLFLYDRDEDCPCFADNYYDSIESAKNYCLEEYNIHKDDWEIINNPQNDCQDDWISPVRIKGRNEGQPQWNKYEMLKNGKWIDIDS